MLKKQIISFLFVVLLPVLVISYTMPFYEVLYEVSAETNPNSEDCCGKVSFDNDDVDDVEFICFKSRTLLHLPELCAQATYTLSEGLSSSILSLDTPPPKA
jgi:hypothetical protein